MSAPRLDNLGEREIDRHFPLVWALPDPSGWCGWVVCVGHKEAARCWTRWGANRLVERIRAEQQAEFMDAL